MLIRGGIIMRISMISNVILTSEQSQDYHLENVMQTLQMLRC